MANLGDWVFCQDLESGRCLGVHNDGEQHQLQERLHIYQVGRTTRNMQLSMPGTAHICHARDQNSIIACSPAVPSPPLPLSCQPTPPSSSPQYFHLRKTQCWVCSISTHST